MNHLYNIIIQLVDKLILPIFSFFSKKINRFRINRIDLIEKIKNELIDKNENIWFHAASLGEYEIAVPIIALGSLYIFTVFLIEHYEGKFPFWLAPIQLVIATITSKADEYAHKIEEKFIEKGIRVILDSRNEKINYKVREHSVNKIPFIFVVGVNEMNDGTVAIRKLGSDKQEILSIQDSVDLILKETAAPDS